MIADAIGAVLGLYGGPIWSIILSVAFNEDESIKLNKEPENYSVINNMTDTSIASCTWKY
jgi:hypothetical protein